jgi:hypothetical protein
MYTTGVLNKHWNSVDGGIDPVLKSLYNNVGVELEPLVKLYTLGNMSELNSLLTYEHYSDLAVKLSNEKGEFSEVYTKFLRMIMSFTEGLYRGTIQYKECITQIKQLQNEIFQLKNPQKGAVMQVSATMNTVATIREEIAIYIKLYGLPPGLVFKADLMGPIKAGLASASN